VDYSVMCPSCSHTISIETRSFEIAYPLDYENRIKNFISDSCRKCGETNTIRRTASRSRSHEGNLYERQ
jgi:YgiT-type zinc finger domain-containing protein